MHMPKTDIPIIPLQDHSPSPIVLRHPIKRHAHPLHLLVAHLRGLQDLGEEVVRGAAVAEVHDLEGVACGLEDAQARFAQVLGEHGLVQSGVAMDLC